MALLKFKPPRINLSGKGGFWKQIGMIIIGTTISLIFTIFAARMTDDIQRKKDRKLSALMVMSNIEAFARIAESYEEYLASTDSITTWLLSQPIEDLERMPENELNALIDQANTFPFLTYDKSAENIFSNNIETWKNMGNVEFIYLVGQCFSTMNSIEQYWNKRINEVNEAILNIKDHPDDYEGSTIPIKILSNNKVRRMMKGTHFMRAWFAQGAATMRVNNRKNMAAIGISEQKVMELTDRLSHAYEESEEVPEFSDFIPAPLHPDSLSSMSEYDSLIKQSKREQ